MELLAQGPQEWLRLMAFVKESNLIEGIRRTPTDKELTATERFLDWREMTMGAVCELQAVYAPGKPLRSQSNMNVRVGSYIAPDGGPQIIACLEGLCGLLNDPASRKANHPWQRHLEFERLHPFMDGNGRTGRALWAWHMRMTGRDPFALPFLHLFYYQTLEHNPARG